jgi:hypothetical protein
MMPRRVAGQVLTPAVSSRIRLVGSVTLAVGVKVAVQVMPPSLLVRFDSVPLATLRSDRSKPVTASLKVMVTVVVSPMPRRLSATTMVAVGSAVSMAKLLESVVPLPLLPETLVSRRCSGDQVGGVGDVGGRGEGRRPVMPPSLLLTLLSVPLAIVRSRCETAHRFAEGDGHQRGFRPSARVGDHDGGRRHRVGCSWPSWWCRCRCCRPGRCTGVVQDNQVGGSVMPTFGVKVAVQVMPPSLATLLRCRWRRSGRRCRNRSPPR